MPVGLALFLRTPGPESGPPEVVISVPVVPASPGRGIGGGPPLPGASAGGGLAFSPYSSGAFTSAQRFDSGWLSQSMQEASDMIVDLLEAGADVWPFHLPGVSAACPPPESDIRSRARQQMASILWPDLVPHFEDRDDYYEGPELALLIDRACALCTARRETRRLEGNWERRRELLLCYVRTSGSGGAVPPAHMRSEGFRDASVASLMLALGGHCEYCESGTTNQKFELFSTREPQEAPRGPQEAPRSGQEAPERTQEASTRPK